MKNCSECKKDKPLSEFYKSKNGKFGVKSKCKECIKQKYNNYCEVCNKKFTSASKRTRFCSVECKGIDRRNRVQTNCDYCGNKLELRKTQFESHSTHFCNLSCANNYQKENPITGEMSKRYSQIEVICPMCNKNFKTKKYRINRNEITYCSSKCYHKSLKERFKGKKNPMFGKLRPDVTGPLNWNYNPNITPVERIIRRHVKENDIFKRGVREKYNYTCDICNKWGGDNVVHHLNGYHWDKQNRFNTDNGVVLCVCCHRKFHRVYGYKNNTKEQYEKFKNNIICQSITNTIGDDREV